MAEPTLYEALDIPEDASAADIKRAYKRRASKTHPDKVGGDGQVFAVVSRAAAILLDPELRKRYDAGEDVQSPGVDPLVNAALQLWTKMLEEAIDGMKGERPLWAFDQVFDMKRQELEEHKKKTVTKLKNLHRAHSKMRWKRVGEDLLQGYYNNKLTELKEQQRQQREIDQIFQLVQEYRDRYEEGVSPY